LRFIEVAETGDTDVDVFEGEVTWIGEAKLDFLETMRETGENESSQGWGWRVPAAEGDEAWCREIVC